MALGHTVSLMPPAYVKPYVKRQKNDAADAEAICEAVTRATMRFVEIKTAAAELPDAPPYTPALHPPAELGDQCHPRPSGRVRDSWRLLSGLSGVIELRRRNGHGLKSKGSHGR